MDHAEIGRRPDGRNAGFASTQPFLFFWELVPGKRNKMEISTVTYPNGTIVSYGLSFNPGH